MINGFESIAGQINTEIKKPFSDVPLFINLFKDKINCKYPGGEGFRAHQDQPAWTDFNSKFYFTVAMFPDKATLYVCAIEDRQYKVFQQVKYFANIRKKS